MLARDLGMTVAELGVRMSARELMWWGALYTQERVEHEEQQQKQRARRR